MVTGHGFHFLMFRRLNWLFFLLADEENFFADVPD
jgi:hypothetical protein